MSLSGLVFGCYHGNPVQILYASLMGLAMALVYESYGRISAPILFHISANAVVYTCSKLGFFAGGTKTAKLPCYRYCIVTHTDTTTFLHCIQCAFFHFSMLQNGVNCTGYKGI